jgi:hypothetical protein
LAAALVITIWQLRINANSQNGPLSLVLSSQSQAYALGDVIDLNFEITNTSGEPLAIKVPGVGQGTLRVFVAKDGGDYTEYVGPKWGTINSGRKTVKLEADEKFQTRATVLYNTRIRTDDLTPMYAEKYQKERLANDFAMTEPGSFKLKAVYSDGVNNLSSEPIDVQMSLPTGTDAVVWERIKNNGAFAYFLQTGDVKFLPGTPAFAQFNDELRQIVNDHPGTAIGDKLNMRSVKYDEMMETTRRLKAEHQTER